jgi:hypothetical protein
MVRAMRRDGPDFLIIIGVISVIVAAAFLALGSGTTETHISPAVTLPDPAVLGPSETTSALVVAKRQFGGTAILGFTFGKESYRVSAQFYAAAGCLPLVESGDMWPTPFDECATGIDLAGEISGLGLAATGESIMLVDIEVLEDCFDIVPIESAWPTDLPACVEGS